MSEEKGTIEDCKELIQELKQHKDKDFIGRLYYKNKPVEDILSVLLHLIENQQKELNNLKEIEKSHQEENGKLRVELEQEKNKINIIKQLMSIGDVTDEALFTLVQTTIAELERLEGIEEQLDKEKEKNKELTKQLNGAFDRGFISKDKVKEVIEKSFDEMLNHSNKFNCGDMQMLENNIVELLEEE